MYGGYESKLNVNIQEHIRVPQLMEKKIRPYGNSVIYQNACND